MSDEAREAWLSLFNENVTKVWCGERRELRKVAMILFILETEFKSIQDELQNRFAECRKALNAGDSVSSPHSSGRDKENTVPGIVPLQVSNTRKQSGSTLISPEIFRCKDSPDISLLSYQHISKNDSSSDEVCVSQKSPSPKINKHRKFSRLKRPSVIAASYSLLNMPKSGFRTPEIVIDDSVCRASESKCFDNGDMVESTIIDVTPNISHMSKRAKCGRVGNNSVSPKKTRKKQKDSKKLINSTLTQMFSDIASSTNNKDVKEDDDVDPTYCQLDEGASVFRQNGTETIKELDETNLDPLLVGFTTDVRDKQPTNEPCKPKIVYKGEPVRGKERLKLEGWDCKECKQFYEALGNNPEEIKKLMNKCSRHRSKFQHHDHTIPGFWNADFTPTQRDDDDDHYDSTIFNF